MKHILIGGLDVSRIGLGAMSMSGYYNIGEGSDAESIRAIHRAMDLGVTHLDTAESTAPSATRNSSAGPSRAVAIRSCWRRSSASSRTPVAAPALR
jgi:predicted aldo/keto reductase-like oxidoreductase